MTSPNINVITLLGAIVGYSAMVLLGVDSKWVSHGTMQAMLQVCIGTDPA